MELVVDKIQTRLFVPEKDDFPSTFILSLPDAFGVNDKKVNQFVSRFSSTLNITVVLMDPFRGDPLNGGSPVNIDYSKLPGILNDLLLIRLVSDTYF